MTNFDAVYVMGDIHGKVPNVLNKFIKENNSTEENIIILLGDVGANYYLDIRDKYFKRRLANIPAQIYCLRGNHEARPADLDFPVVYDQITENCVFIEPNYPNIKYLIDGECYNFNGISCLALGGAYSVDKEYRILTNAKWFSNEQLSEEERKEIEQKWFGKKVDVILSHTCPSSFQPIELFLSGINQAKVDKTTEQWLEKIKENIQWKGWLFGHYHQTKTVDRHIKMLSDDCLLNLERWFNAI